MCTVSWSPGPDTYHVIFNRDEQRNRNAARPPAVMSGEKHRFVAPIDPESAGTWMAVNDAGLTFCLLNRFVGDPLPASPHPRLSRGTLITTLAGTASSMADVTRILDRPLAPFEPFIVVGFDGRRFIKAEWDGTDQWSEEGSHDGLVATTSSFDPPAVMRERSNAFRAVTSARVDELLMVHRSHDTDRSPHSVCLHRDQIASLSLTHAAVTSQSVRMEYFEGAPCETKVPHVTMLARVG